MNAEQSAPDIMGKLNCVVGPEYPECYSMYTAMYRLLDISRSFSFVSRNRLYNIVIRRVREELDK